jgi:hypothetical protein
MIAAISTTIADTMSQPNAIATPLTSSRKSSLFPILRARFRNAGHISPPEAMGEAFIDRRIEGTIDRVTGDVNATDTLTNLKTSKIAYSTRYALKCRPTQRIF